jgi:HD-GYP domain-containing protein (c-di-GMP phosphodiesterase class II)
MAKEQNSRAFRPEDSTTDIRNLLLQERKAKAEFTSDIREAAKLHGRARANLARLSEDMLAGRPLALDITREVVQAIYDSMQKNPNVLVWMTNMQMPYEHHACHSFNVCVLSMLFGKHRGKNRSDLMALGTGGMLHDLGKTRISTELLDKPARLDDDERDIVRRHADEGYKALSATGRLTNDILDIVRCHHERADGNGYPAGLFGDNVPELARMVAITDAYDSIIYGYGYRTPVTPTDALHTLKSQAAEEYGEDLVEDFIRCMGIYPVGSIVKLNSGAVVMVIASNTQARLKPKVMTLCNEDGKFEKPRMLADLANYNDVELTERWGIRGLVNPSVLPFDVRSVILEEIQF